MISLRNCRRAVVLTALIYLTAGPWARASAAQGAPEWVPAKTRAFIVCLTRFQGKGLHSFSTDDRLDGRLVEVLKSRGVPAGQIVFLADERATGQAIQGAFTTFLQQSRPGEMLLFYFGSHGVYDPRTGHCSFVTFDGSLPFDWAFDAIERDFRGTYALLTADCCHSGGIVDLALERRTKIAYACLSSTFTHQTAWSGWRFLQCLLRAFEGNSVVGCDRRGRITLRHLAEYTESYMAFAAEGRPMFAVTNGFDPDLCLAKCASTLRDPRIGSLVEVQSDRPWAKAEILDVSGRDVLVHFTQDTRSDNDAWLSEELIRARKLPHFSAGTKVELKAAGSGKWFVGTVLQADRSLTLCRYDGYGPEYDEWFGPSRIRPTFAGSWTGWWQNDASQEGQDSLDLQMLDGDRLSGTWTGGLAVTGERLGPDVFVFESRSPDRVYRAAGRVTDQQLRLDYSARSEEGRYIGRSTLRRSGPVSEAERDPPQRIAGTWEGHYENSKSSHGTERLELSEDAGQLKGNWSGLIVAGERLGNAVLYLESRDKNRKYRVVGVVDQDELMLHYSATDRNDRYYGWSRLKK